MQTWDHLFKVRSECKAQRKILGAEVRKEGGWRKHLFTIRDLLTDKRCGQAVLAFFSTTDAGRLVPTWEEAGCEVPEWERREREEEGRAEAEELGAAGELGAGEELPLFIAHYLFRGIRRRGLGGGLCLLLFVSFVTFFVRSLFRCDFFGAYHIF